MSTTESTDDPPAPSGSTDWTAVQASPDFQQLRKRLRGFVFPVTAGFLAWYLLYVLLASYAPDFMATPVLGNINIGLIFGLLQFVSTFAITITYIRFADRKLDPLSSKIRDEIEGGSR
ncbi:uncharacterized membrane protein (DUF485 family) [Pseudonocardia sediminis]|uniref:Uncharacterized membrane protein (DUF485 family) n=1 Tax=Pseudonocardia sediminis TaxID=1397368 RepID=A0A4Q7UR30_PSEST|nr:DUF485 domain-containing protein [Pseudonocardia sediminis]RZT84142.1 uncharacterized membrane protein (DUF485 family) [Pseudonocardia sediminis]